MAFVENMSTMTTGSSIWPVWNQVYTVTSTINSVTNATAYTWTIWNATYPVTGTAATVVTMNQTINTTWTNWNYHYPREGGIIRQPTQAELKAAKERADREAREWAERERKRVAEVSAAKRRAEDLLRRHLTKEQIEDLEKKDCFYLESVGKDGGRRRYRIDRGTHGNVKLVDKDNKIVGSYCVQPSGVPTEDAMLAQKLWLETDEAEFVRVANFRSY